MVVICPNNNSSCKPCHHSEAHEKVDSCSYTTAICSDKLPCGYYNPNQDLTEALTRLTNVLIDFKKTLEKIFEPDKEKKGIDDGIYKSTVGKVLK